MNSFFNSKFVLFLSVNPKTEKAKWNLSIQCTSLVKKLISEGIWRSYWSSTYTMTVVPVGGPEGPPGSAGQPVSGSAPPQK